MIQEVVGVGGFASECSRFGFSCGHWGGFQTAGSFQLFFCCRSVTCCSATTGGDEIWTRLRTPPILWSDQCRDQEYQRSAAVARTNRRRLTFVLLAHERPRILGERDSGAMPFSLCLAGLWPAVLPLEERGVDLALTLAGGSGQVQFAGAWWQRVGEPWISRLAGGRAAGLRASLVGRASPLLRTVQPVRVTSALTGSEVGMSRNVRRAP